MSSEIPRNPVENVAIQHPKVCTRSSEADMERLECIEALRLPDEVTCYFVSDELARLDLSDAAEQALELVLGHVLRQVVDDQVGLAVLQATRLHR